MSNLAVSIGVGATMQASVGAVVGSTVRHLDKLRKSTEALQQRTQRITAYRDLETDLAKTRTRARQATERVVKMGEAMRRIKQPSQAMRDALGKARAEAKRLNDRISEQSRKLGEVRRQMRQAGDAVKDLDAHERTLGRTLDRQRTRLERLGRAHAARDAARQRRADARGGLVDAAALGYSVFRPIIGATRAAIRFESVMADVRKVVDFDTPQQFAQMGEDVLKLSQRMPVAASGIGDIVAAAGQAGIAREELLRFAEDASKVAVAFDISGGEAGGRLTGLKSIFKLNLDEVMHLAGAYNHLSNNMDATAPAMLNVAERAGKVARDFGLTGEQTGALAATMLALKTPPEVAATAINALLVKLTNAPEQPKKFQEALDDLGVSAEDLKDDIGKDAQGALLKFLEAVDQADDKQSILFNLFGQEYVDDITGLVGAIDIYRDALGLASDDAAHATSIQKEYEARAATTANQLELLTNKTNALGVNIGSVLLPSVNSAVGGIGDLVSKGAALAKEFPGATRLVIGLVGGLVGLRVISAFGGYAATFLAEGWAVGRIAMYRAADGAAWLGRSLRGLSLRSIPRAIGSLKLLRVALIGTGIGAAVVAIGVGAALIMRYWEPVSAFFRGVASGFAEAFRPLEPVFGWLGDILGWIGRAFSALSQPVDATAEDLKKFSSVGERVGNLVGSVFRFALTPVTGLIKAVGTALKWLGLLDETEVETAIKTADESERRSPPPPPRSPRRGVVAAAVTAVGIGAAAPAAATPVEPLPPAYPAPVAVTAPVATATEPVAVVAAPVAPTVDAVGIAAQIRAELSGIPGLGDAASDAQGGAAFERIDAGLAAPGARDGAGIVGATATPETPAPTEDRQRETDALRTSIDGLGATPAPVTPVPTEVPVAPITPVIDGTAIAAEITPELRALQAGIVGATATPETPAPTEDRQRETDALRTSIDGLGATPAPVTPVPTEVPVAPITPVIDGTAIAAEITPELRALQAGIVGATATPETPAPTEDRQRETDALRTSIDGLGATPAPVTPVPTEVPVAPITPVIDGTAIAAEITPELRALQAGIVGATATPETPAPTEDRQRETDALRTSIDGLGATPAPVTPVPTEVPVAPITPVIDGTAIAAEITPELRALQAGIVGATATPETPAPTEDRQRETDALRTSIDGLGATPAPVTPVPTEVPVAPITPVIDGTAIAAEITPELRALQAGIVGATATPETPAPTEDRQRETDALRTSIDGLGATPAPVASIVPAPPHAEFGPTPVTPQQPSGPSETTLVFHQTFTFHGVGPDVAEEVTRQMELVMRRASVEAGLAESDDAF